MGSSRWCRIAGTPSAASSTGVAHSAWPCPPWLRSAPPPRRHVPLPHRLPQRAYLPHASLRHRIGSATTWPVAPASCTPGAGHRLERQLHHPHLLARSMHGWRQSDADNVLTFINLGDLWDAFRECSAYGHTTPLCQLFLTVVAMALCSITSLTYVQFNFMVDLGGIFSIRGKKKLLHFVK